MFFGELPRTQYDLHFSLFGVPVRVHPFFWLVAILLGLNSKNATAILIWTVALFVSILWHEMGHALVMRAYGFLPWITLHGMGGTTSYDPSRTYSSRGASPLGQILISMAGPGAGFLLAGLLIGGIILSGHGDEIYLIPEYMWLPQVSGMANERLADLLNQVLFISTIWGLVNLLPIYPLDGGQIAREILVTLNAREGIRQSLILSIAAGAMMAVFGLVRWHSLFVAILFGYLAYMSYTALRAYGGRDY